MGNRDAGELRLAAKRGKVVVDLFRFFRLVSVVVGTTSLQKMMELRFPTGVGGSSLRGICC